MFNNYQPQSQQGLLDDLKPAVEQLTQNGIPVFVSFETKTLAVLGLVVFGGVVLAGLAFRLISGPSKSA